MILRDVNLIIDKKNERICPEKIIRVYQYDRGIQFNFKLKNTPHVYAARIFEDVLIDSEFKLARAILLKPNKVDSFVTGVAPITDGIIHINIDNTWTDDLDEIGTYQMQIQLFTEDTDNHCLTLPPFDIEVTGLIADPARPVTLAKINHGVINRARISKSDSSYTIRQAPIIIDEMEIDEEYPDLNI